MIDVTWERTMEIDEVDTDHGGQAGLAPAVIDANLTYSRGAMNVSTFFQCLLLAIVVVSTEQQRFDCHTGDCVNRKDFLIRAILHGERSDPFWQQLQASMIQTAQDLRVQLDLTTYDNFDSDTMASDIEQSVFLNPDALIVTLPDATIQRAVGNLISSTSIPVFGVNSGYDIGASLNVQGFVAMDDSIAGMQAGETFRQALVKADGELKNGTGLFVNSEAGNLAVQTLMFSLQDALPELEISSLAFDAGTSQTEMTTQLTSQFANCPYRVVQLSSSTPLQPALAALASNGCDQTLLGAVHTNDSVYAAIRQGNLLFSISQQANLQGAFPVLMATLFATTGQALAPASLSQDGTYLSGPVIVNKTTLPSDRREQCQSDAFPICPNTMNAAGQPSTCPCTDRKRFKLAGITHGVTTDSFWDAVYAAMHQAALDFDVNVQAVRLEPTQTDDVVSSKMATQIREFCSQDIDGLFVSIPSDVVVEALKDCLALGVPIVSLNSGAQAAQDLGLHEHIGQLEFRAGEGAGQRLIGDGVIYGYCLMHETDNSGLLERCAGMKDAFDSSQVEGVKYMGSFDVPKDDVAKYKVAVESAVNVTNSSWDGVGVLLCGQLQVPSILSVRKDHPNMKIGSFDTSLELFDAIDKGTILFGIDQNSYLQGYLPVALLTLYAYTKQQLVDLFVESGPDFIESVPTAEKQQCQTDLFVACFDNSTDADGAGTGLTSSRLSPGAIAGIAICCVLAILFFVYALYRNRLLSEKLRELRTNGETVPQISIARRLMCMIKPVDQVIDGTKQLAESVPEEASKRSDRISIGADGSN